MIFALLGDRKELEVRIILLVLRLCPCKKLEDFTNDFFIWITRARLGEVTAADQELAAYIAERWNGAPADWPSNIARFLVGKMTEPDFFAASASPDAKKERAHKSMAWFYAGMKHLLTGDRTTAADYFRKCLAVL